MRNLIETIEQTNGKILTVVFTKKDGTERTLNGRLGVTKHLHGGKRTSGEDYLNIFDLKNKGYRCVNKSTIKEVRFGGEVIK